MHMARLKTALLGPGVLVTIACDLVLLLAYIWFISIGTWTHWPTASSAYDQLATAFAQGHTWLDQQPDPRILALSDPYDPGQRSGLPYPLDYSLFQGRYYLYWGPAPALLLLAVKWLHPGVIGDQYLVLFFTFGIAVLQSLLLMRIWRRFFSSVPVVLLAMMILAAGLAGPYTPSLGVPTFYVAAIVAGQMLLLAGLYTIFPWAETDVSPPLFLLAGIFWGAAIASRLTQAVPVAVLLIFVLVRTAQPGSARLFPRLLAVACPLFITAALLGWYNWIRFGSVLETGFRYALAGGIPLHAAQTALFSPAYVSQNLYDYLLNPLVVHPAFPYLGRANLLLTLSSSLAPLHGWEWITGLLYTVPLAAFAVVPVIVLVRSLHPARFRESARQPLLWWIGALAASFVASLAVLLAYFWIAERFLIDFLPELALLSAIGLWQLYHGSRRYRYGPAFVALLCAAIIGASLLTSSLLAISINSDGFRQLNPGLWRMLSNLVRKSAHLSP